MALRLTERFGELRALLAGQPSAWRWRFICALLGEVHDQAWLAEQAIPYAERALVSWPDALRVAPLDWVRRVADGEHVPALRLARSLRDMPELLVSDHGTSSANQGYRVPVLDHITVAEVSAASVCFELGWLLERLPGLRELVCDDVRWFEQIGPLDVWRQLRRVRLRGASADGLGGVLRALVDSGAHEVLEVFSVDDAAWWSEDARELLAGRSWPALRELSLMAYEPLRYGPLPELLDGATGLESLHLAPRQQLGLSHWWPLLRDSASAATLTALSLQGGAVPVDLREGLPRLESLSLDGCHQGQAAASCEGLRALSIVDCNASVIAPLLSEPSLERLVVREPHGELDALVRHLGRWLHLPGLAHLELELPISAGRQLPAMGVSAPLKTLKTWHTFWAPEDMRALGEGASGEALETLHVEGGGLWSGHVEALASNLLPALRRLGMADNALGARGVGVILDAPWFGQLRALVLDDNALDVEATELWQRASRSQIEALGWSGALRGVAPERAAQALRAMLARPALGELRALGLGRGVPEVCVDVLVEASAELWALSFRPEGDLSAELCVRFDSPRLSHLCDEAMRAALQLQWLHRPDIFAEPLRVLPERLRGVPWLDAWTVQHPGEPPRFTMKRALRREPLDWSRWWEWAAC